MSDLKQSLSKLKAASDLLEQNSGSDIKTESVASLHQTLNEMQEHLESIKTKITVSGNTAIRYVD